MDGRFVNNTTYGHEMLDVVGEFSDQFFDVHLMIEKPENQVYEYIRRKADLITFHYEATFAPLNLIKDIKSHKIKAGISIKPATDVRVLDNVLPEVDLILLMSVEPGQGGQKFMKDILYKIEYLVEKRKKYNYRYLIEVDGGINLETAKMVKKAGCDVVVAGSFIFNQKDRNKAIEELENV